VTDDRWREIEALFQEAVEQPEAGREAFLDRVCAHDPELRRELESLLRHARHSGEFLSAPVAEWARQIAASDLQPGQPVGPYEILAWAGAGGMGEVYVARDVRLDRQVALKLLPAALARDGEWTQRFAREARALSALNHPNIVTVYDVGEADGRPWMATEFVQGVTLRARMSQGRLPVVDALAIFRQVLAALSAAHQAGIVHRDVKPENIMVRPDGVVKLLDFGLAKAAGPDPSLTGEAARLGTVRYMSPEQLSGRPVGRPSDVWSAGIVLAEMLSGAHPFAGTPAQIVAAVPKASLRLPDVLPFRAVIEKALATSPEDRYATAGEMLAALRESPSRWRLVAALLAALALVILGSFASYRLLRASRAPTAPALLEKMKLARLTSHGKGIDAEVSPDGKYVAYVMEDGGQQSLWMRHIATGSTVPIVPPSEMVFDGLAFAPDGNHVYYTLTTASRGFGEGTLYRRPVLGGTAQKVLASLDGRIAFSRDGTHFAFVREGQEGNHLMLAEADGAGARVLVSRKTLDEFWSGPAWSPDGTLIACPVRSLSGGPHAEVVVVRVADGAVERLSGKKWLWPSTLAWLPDGRGLVFAARDEASATPQIWQLAYPGGTAQKLTNDLNSYRTVSLTADGSALVTVQSEEVSNIWVALEGSADRTIQLTSGIGRYDGADGLAWTPGGEIVFWTRANGTNDLWIGGLSGAEPRPLIERGAGVGWGVAVSPDGSHVVFSSDRAGTTNLWQVDADGSNLRQLTYGRDGLAFLPAFSPDGTWLAYTIRAGAGPSVWKVPAEGGPSVQLSSGGMIRAHTVSPDGNRIACSYIGDAQPGTKERLAVMSAAGGPPLRVFDDVVLYPFERWRAFQVLDAVRWAPHGNALTYIVTQGGVSNIWSQLLDGGPPKPVTSFRTGRIFNFDWSRDGRHLALARGSLMSDVVLISNFK
jgi:eukaryotic-like serine/threonine-protein kinase